MTEDHATFVRGVEKLSKLTPAEMRVAVRIIERIAKGNATIGPLEARLGTGVDWRGERQQELDDAIIYEAIEEEERALLRIVAGVEIAPIPVRREQVKCLRCKTWFRSPTERHAHENECDGGEGRPLCCFTCLYHFEERYERGGSQRPAWALWNKHLDGGGSWVECVRCRATHPTCWSKLRHVGGCSEAES